MKRETKVERARKLREEDPKRWTYKALGERFGVTQGCVQKWLKPEWAQEKARLSNAKRGAAKRAWEKEQTALCPQCGGKMGLGSALPSKQPRGGICRACLRDEARRRTVRFIELREAGYLNTEIAAQEDVSQAVVASAFSRASKDFGLEVPPSPYYWAEIPERVAA